MRVKDLPGLSWRLVLAVLIATTLLSLQASAMLHRGGGVAGRGAGAGFLLLNDGGFVLINEGGKVMLNAD